jgi:hypothetical protein
MVSELPEQLLEQAKFLLTLEPNQANLREIVLDPADAMAQVNRADSAFRSWEMTRNSDVAKDYLFSLLFKERERS